MIAHALAFSGVAAAVGIAVARWVAVGASPAGRIGFGGMAGLVVAVNVFLLPMSLGAPMPGAVVCGGIALIGWLTAVVIGLRGQTSGTSLNWSDGRKKMTPAAWLVLAGAGILGAWALVSALALPPMDYDSHAVWGLRLRALLDEGSLFGATFTDPTRITPMARHPYFFSVMEALAARGGADAAVAAGRHVPVAVAFVFYLCIAWDAAGRMEATVRAPAAAALMLMPVMAMHIMVDSPRETLQGMLGLAALAAAARWLQDRRTGWLALAGLFAFALQQVKIDGLPLAVGLMAALFTEAALARRWRRDAAWVVCVGVTALALTLPWLWHRGHIPVTLHSYDVSTNLLSDPLARLKALPGVLGMLAGELFARPELYGIAPFVLVWALATGWGRGADRTDRITRLVLLAGPLLCMAAVVVVYVARQSYLPDERNVSFSRRVVVFLPALVLAALHRVQRGGKENGAGTKSAAPH